MKHSIKITSLLIIFFLITQIIGLTLISLSANKQTQVIDGKTITTINYTETALGERPQFKTSYGPLIYLMSGVFLGTILIFILMKIKLGGKLWKYWYLMAVIFSITIALGVITTKTFALLIGIILGLLKINKPGDFWIHNTTEILMYAGLGVLLAPLFTIMWAIILLLIISFYDAYAVWKSKHMIKLAKFTMKNKLFAGLYINYKQTNNKTKIILNPSRSIKKTISHPEEAGKPKHEKTTKQAILGGGDVVFPLILSGTVFTRLLNKGFEPLTAVLTTGIISITTTISLYILFYAGKKNKFYPAMPFITTGSLVGLGLIELILNIF